MHENILSLYNIGVHLSIKGSYFYLFEQAEKLGITTFACFTASNLKYELKSIIDEGILKEFLKIKRDRKYTIFSHACYLINIANNNNIEIYNKSVEAIEAELRRCQQLEITGVAFHPGSNKNRQLGLQSILDTISKLDILDEGDTHLLIESSAGQGNTLPSSLEEIAFINDRLSPERKKKVKFVFDSCHMFAAGYNLSTEQAIKDVMQKYDKLIGLDRIGLIHLNDSKYPCGSRKDRHETLGKGYIGEEGIISLINYPELTGVSKILETPVNSYLDWRFELDWIQRSIIPV